MLYALLVLGLLPMLFMADIFPDAGEEEGEGDEALTNGTGAGDVLGVILGESSGTSEDGAGADGKTGDGADVKDTVRDGLTGDRWLIMDDSGMLPDMPETGDVIAPDTGDDIPPDEPLPVDPDTVIAPDTGDDAPPDEPLPVEGPVLDPNDTPGEEYPIAGDGTLLQRLLAEQSDATTGIGFLGTRITETTDIGLGEGDDGFALDDDGIAGTGTGEMRLWNGTPLVDAEGGPVVVDAGGGDDVITSGDAAAYVFGGAGDDVITLGEGAAAAFGGDGADVITGSDAADPDGHATFYLNGGAGSDLIHGRAAHEYIEGGVHEDGTGEADDDTLDGGGGNDSIRGGHGADSISGGAGSDVIDHLGHAEERVAAERHEFNWHIDNDADTLDGGDGDDTLIFDRADVATGGAGNDTFWLYFDHGSGAGHAEVTDFEPGADFLRIELNPEAVRGEPVVGVGPSDDGEDGIVTVNGAVVAVLTGSPHATAADIYVEITENLFR